MVKPWIIDWLLVIALFVRKFSLFNKNKKKCIAAKSNAMVELWAMTQWICELLWFKIIPIELSETIEESIKVYCEYKVTIHIAHNHVQYNKTKHVEIKRHFTKEKISIR